MGCLHQLPPLRAQYPMEEVTDLRVEGMEHTRSGRFSKSTKQGSYEPTEPEEASTRLTQSVPDLLSIYYSLVFLQNSWVCESSGSLILVSALGALFLLLGFLFQLQCDGFCFMFYFVMFGCYLLEACSFLMRDKGSGFDWGDGKSRGRETTIRIYYVRKSIFVCLFVLIFLRQGFSV